MDIVFSGYLFNACRVYSDLPLYFLVLAIFFFFFLQRVGSVCVDDYLGFPLSSSVMTKK